MTAKPEIQPWMEPAEERIKFETWYVTNIGDLSACPIGSRECYLQWKAWQAAIAAHAPKNKWTDIKDFIAEIESTPEGKAGMDEARKWLPSHFITHWMPLPIIQTAEKEQK